MTIDAKIDFDPRIKLKAKRSLDGNIMIFDHEDIDIVVLPEQKKCVTFPKEAMSDKVYSAQDRMFRFLSKRGVVTHSSVRGGNVFGSMEAELLESSVKGIDSVQALLVSLYEYLNQERPYFKSSEEYDDERIDSLLRPDDSSSTELGDVPHSDSKGSMTKQIGPYGFQYNYSLVREDEDKG
jgi:hypothetical protein